MLNEFELKLQEYLLARELLKRKAAEGDLLSFTKFTFPNYEINWHHILICEYLQKFIRKEIKRLMIFLPPRYGKSELTSRRLPALLHGLFPDDEILHGSYNETLASEFAIDVQRIMDGDEYRSLFPNIRIPGINRRQGYRRTSTEHELIPVFDPVANTIHKPCGSYYAAGLGGSFTGRGGDWILLDDLIKSRNEAESLAYRNACFDFYTSAVRTRLEKNASVLLTMTLWHQDDVAGRLIKVAKESPKADQWVCLRLPAMREDDFCEYDKRKRNEPLWPSKFSMDELEATRASLPARDWASLYQQRPTIQSGNIVKRDWWQYYDRIGDDEVLETVQFWDCAQKVGLTNDFSVCATWARTKSSFHVLDVWRGRLEAPDLERKAVEQFNKFRPSAVVIEDKSSGSSLIQNLRRFTPIPILAYNPGQKDKVVRISAAAPTIEARKVHLPKRADWVETFVAEHEHFPGEYDDQVDTTSMAVDFFNRTMGIDPSIRTL